MSVSASFAPVWRGLNRSPTRAAWIATLLASLSLLLYQGTPYLFDWDELIYGSLARHMVLTGRWWELAINDLPFWEKPPLFFWTQALSFQLLGISETAARLPSALAGGGMVGVCVWMGSHLQGPPLGWTWGAVLAMGWLPLLFAKTGLIDPLFNLWMAIGLGAGFVFEQERRWGRSGRRALLLSACALGLAVLTKGPLGLGLPLVIGLGYKLWHRHPWPTLWDGGIFWGLSLGVALSWFGLEIWIQGPEFVIQFIAYQWRILRTPDGHPGPIYFHLLAYGLGCFPFAALSLSQIWIQIRPNPSPDPESVALERSAPVDLQRWTHLMLLAFGIVLGLFSCVVQTKLIHYTSLLYPIGSYFAAFRLCAWGSGRSTPHLLETIWIGISGLVWVGLLLALPWIGQQAALISAQLTDPITQGYLMAAVDWPGYTYSPGIVLLIGLVIWGLSHRRVSCRAQLQGWGILLLATWLSGQLFWAQIAPRILRHTQGGAVEICQRFLSSSPTAAADQDTPLALYGSRSFIPYFYGPPQVPYTDALWHLIPWVDNDHIDSVLTWLPWQTELTQQLPLQVQEISGAYVLLQVEQ